MRVYALLLVAAATLSAQADTDTFLTRSISPFDRLTPSHQHEPQWYLRDGVDVLDEERTPEFLTLLDDMSIAGPPSDTYLTSFIQKYGNLKADETFASFQLGKAGDNLLKDPQFIWWARIMQHQNRFDPESAIAELLTSQYTDYDYLKMLEKSTQDSNTKDLATRLQDGWIKLKVDAVENPTDSDIRDARGPLELDDKMLSSPPFKVYYGLMEKKYGETDKLYAAMAKQLVIHFNTDSFLSFMERGTKDPATKNLATNLQDGWVRYQVNTIKPTRFEISDALNEIDLDDKMLLSTPHFKVCYGLMEKKYRKTDELKSEMMVAIQLASHYYEHYGTKLHDVKGGILFFEMLEKSTMDPATLDMATKLQRGFMNFGLKTEMDADEMFHVIHLDVVDVKKVLTTSRFNLWLKYVTEKLYKGKPEEAMAKMAKAMATKYGAGPLLKMLETFSHPDLDTQDIATKLLFALRSSNPQ